LRDIDVAVACFVLKKFLEVMIKLCGTQKPLALGWLAFPNGFISAEVETDRR
jgi:hypothetical protein